MRLRPWRTNRYGAGALSLLANPRDMHDISVPDVVVTGFAIATLDGSLWKSRLLVVSS